MIRTRTVVAILVALVAIGSYAVLWVGEAEHWRWLSSFDWSLLNAAHDIGIKHPAWVWFWSVVCFVLGPFVLRPLCLLVAVIALVQRKVRMALLLLVCGPLIGLVTMVAKGLADRPRPATALVAAPSTSFPSGHALEAVTCAFALLTFLLPMVASRSTLSAATEY